MGKHLVLFACLIIGACGHSDSFVIESPFVTGEMLKSDGELGVFYQNDTGDCFFLASLIAIVQDMDGKELIKTAFQVNQGNQWEIIFPGFPDQAIMVFQRDVDRYKMKNSDGNGLSSPATGDLDVRILEIAADKIWKKNIKIEGLWDDVPMNAVAMFYLDRQLLIWNPEKAKTTTIQDIKKYHRLSAHTVEEHTVTSKAEVAKALKKIAMTDKDGLSMILIDYIKYHAVAIVELNFSTSSYRYIDTYSNTQYEKGLESLLAGIVNGRYAINYLEP